MKKENIIKNNFDFQRIIKENRPYKYKEYIIYLEKNKEETYHFGFSVGKKIGNAVVRNKIKRQLRSIVSKKDYQNGFNCIIIVGSNILNKTFEQRELVLLEVLQKLNLLKENKNA
ncbi:MAG: ribonuclease P protein component [Bacilli bacterium]